MPPAGQQQQGGDNSLGPLWIIIGCFALGLGIWYFAHEQIAMAVLQARLYEAKLISYFVPDAAQQVTLIQNTSPATATFDVLADISTAIGNYLRYPIAAIMGLLAVMIFFSSASMRYKKTYDMQRLVDEEKVSWPQISPVAGVDLVATNIDEGPWAMALPPMKFAKKYNLLQLERTVSGEGFSGHGRITATLRRDEAMRIFVLQVGRYWRGADQLPIHAKALFAVFAARANRDRDGATKLLLQIAASTKDGKLDFSGVEELLGKHRNNSAVNKVTQSHAFNLTVMASMLLLARTDGVLASADFLWLRPIDRPLWLILNSVGRQVPFAEVAGPFAHWLAERKLGRKLNVPMVEEAVNALELVMQDTLYVPDEGEEVT